jgi:hypothetical protein
VEVSLGFTCTDPHCIFKGINLLCNIESE